MTFFRAVFEVLGIFLVVFEVADIFDWDVYLVQFVRDRWWILAILGSIVGIHRAWPRLSVKFMISGTDSFIKIAVCDLFKQEGAVVVSSNSTFDTAMEDETIDKSSTQGQYQTQFCDNLRELDQKIENALSGESFEELDRRVKPYGNRKKYALGTVALVKSSNKLAYFLAISDLDANRNAYSTKANILDTLPKLWEYIRIRGGTESVTIPVIGTGLARVTGTREQFIREIVKSYIASAQLGGGCEELTISISPADYTRKNINLLELGRYLQHECTYPYGTSSDLLETPEVQIEETPIDVVESGTEVQEGLIEASTDNNKQLAVDDDHRGFLDYLVEFHDNIEAVTSIFNELSTRLSTMSLTTESAVARIKGRDRQNPRQQRLTMKSLAAQIQRFATWLRENNNRYSQSMNKVDESLHAIVGGDFPFIIQDRNETKRFIRTLILSEKSAKNALGSFEALIDELDELPSIEQDFNRAKIRLRAELKGLTRNIEGTLGTFSSAREAIGNFFANEV